MYTTSKKKAKIATGTEKSGAHTLINNRKGCNKTEL